MNGLFVTGSDTGVGKTYVTAGIAARWRREGRRFRVCKPVATGAGWRGGRLVSDDTQALAEAAGVADLAEVTPWVFAEPAAPTVAARSAGVKVEMRELVGWVRQRSEAGA